MNGYKMQADSYLAIQDRDRNKLYSVLDRFNAKEAESYYMNR